MKKLVLILTFLLLTSCDSTEEFEKNCTLTTKSENTKYTEKVKFIYNNKDEVLKINVLKKYNSKELDLIKESAESYNNALAKKDYIKIRIINDDKEEYALKYYYDVTKMSKQEAETFKINKNWIKLNNKIRKSNLICEKK